MEMETEKEFSGSNDQMISKGKRTKRPRPSSSTISTDGGGGGDIEFHSLASSPTTTSSGISTSTEEDEDMANCLILLAQGDIPKEVKVEKFTSRKFAEMAVTTNGKVGIFVYECKTCNRTFPSFQALGGHRASHKKPKPTMDDPKKCHVMHHEEQQGQEGQFTSSGSPSFSIQASNKVCQSGDNKAKVHECSICGSEFSSGQALGGHMRRHRPTPPRIDINAVTSTNNESSLNEEKSRNDSSLDEEKARNVLELDLNLPAPLEDDHREAKLPFPTTKKHLVFSTPALVDCHN